MGHNLTRKLTGEYEIAYVGQSPWHALGYYLGEERVTSQVMMEKAGIDWRVALRDLYYAQPGPTSDAPPTYTAVESHVATVREDTGAALGIVSKDYKPVQQREQFEFTDALVGEAAAMYEVAGSLAGGRRVWSLARLPQETVVVGDDIVRQYLFATNSHDGTTAMRVGFTGIRVVCENTEQAALSAWESGAVNVVTVRHQGDMKAKIEEARRILGISLRYFEKSGEIFRAMSAKEITDAMLAQYFERVYPLPKEVASDAPELVRLTNNIDREKVRTIHYALMGLYQGQGSGSQLPGVRGTVWGAYNAVTEFVDHVKPATKQGTFRKGGAEAALFGQGAKVKQEAFDAAVALL